MSFKRHLKHCFICSSHGFVCFKRTRRSSCKTSFFGQHTWSSFLKQTMANFYSYGVKTDDFYCTKTCLLMLIMAGVKNQIKGIISGGPSVLVLDMHAESVRWISYCICYFMSVLYYVINSIWTQNASVHIISIQPLAWKCYYYFLISCSAIILFWCNVQKWCFTSRER